MEHEEEWHQGPWMFFRIVFAMVLAVLIFSLIFGSFGIMTSGTGWAWRLIGIVLLLWFVSWIFVWPWRHNYFGGERAMRILRRRYARGEISRAQFKRMMKDLQGSRRGD
jgi:uncharacterized membrane protein